MHTTETTPHTDTDQQTDIAAEPLTPTDVLLAVAWKASTPDNDWVADGDGGPEFIELLTLAASILSHEPTHPDEPGYRLATAVAAFIYAIEREDDLRDVHDEYQEHLAGVVDAEVVEA